MIKPVPLAESRILREYARKTPASADRYRRARQLFPSGVTHDARFLQPHPVFISRAAGARKWDADGNEYVDYFGGHGALILGHNHPVVVEAVQRQLSRGTHFGASHDLELEWASLIQQMVPSAERVRFTGTGTEATLLALRLARTSTGRSKFVRFAGHFHGWHDHVAFGSAGSPVERPRGILPEIVDHAIVSPPNDIASLTSILNSSDDIAAVIVEPTGATFGHIPQSGEFPAHLRQLTAQRGIVLIFDEVISGFRCAPGGAQEYYRVTPDLTALAKILAGGYPGGALAGRAEVMGLMEYDGLAAPAIPHQGTFNAAPISASAGIATLGLIRSSNVIETANLRATALRREMNTVIQRTGCGWCVYGDFSAFHLFTNPDNTPASPGQIQAGMVDWRKLKGGARPELLHKIRAGLLLGGVDISPWPGGWLSSAHEGDDIDRTASAFEQLVRMLAEEGELG